MSLAVAHILHRFVWCPYKIQLHKQRNFIGGSSQSPRSKKIDRYSNWFNKYLRTRYFWQNPHNGT